MKLSIIACINKKRALGKNGDLMYKIPGDLKSFRMLTKGAAIIMGRKTWDSLPVKPLPERVNIVISKDGVKYDPEVNFQEICNMELIKLSSLEDALNFLDDLLGGWSQEEVFIIGGASLYKEAIEKKYVDSLYITEVIDETEGDVYFPEFEDNERWKLWFETDLIVDSKTNFTYKYKFYR